MRFWGVGDIKFLTGDERTFIPAAGNFIESGHFEPETWINPPLNLYTVLLGINIFGNNPYGWRMMHVLLGSLSVPVLFLLAKEVFNETRVAFMASLFLIIDPLHILFSRTNFTEAPSVLFFIAGSYIVIRYLKGSINSPVAGGLFLGFAIAHKWYYFVPIAALVISVLFFKLKDKGLRYTGILHIFSTLIILPACIYLLAYYPWFKRGYNLPEFINMNIDAYKEHQSLVPGGFMHLYLRRFPSSPWDWFSRPLISGVMLGKEGIFGRFLIFMNNPPIWLLTVPALAHMTYHVWKEKDRYKLLLLVLFFSLYLQFILVKRPVFFYSALTVLPFIHLSVAYLLISILKRLKENIWHFRILILAITLWGLYLYPFVTGKLVPVFLYTPLLSIGNIIGY